MLMYRIKKIILKDARGKDQGRPIRIMPYFSINILKAAKAWIDFLQTPKGPGVPSRTIIQRNCIQSQ